MMCPELSRLKLQAQFVQLAVFCESGHGEPRVVDQNIQAFIIPDYGVDKALDRVEFRNLQCANLNSRANPRCGYGLLKPVATAESAHSSHYAKPRFCQFDRSQQPEAAGGASNQGNLLRHGNGLTQPHKNKRPRS